ncbi:hypothetical protein A9Q84_12060 [Halobacteriovorax marinus]|uniref:Lipoprotein n=1 Tax=Halobacteriovorax marinus TaxID=97084 RepID=A0A1Y5FDL7_9BACT|nr:hypothetical protein A9Q84_12060 [Halobacteriovorax marinus]
MKKVKSLFVSVLLVTSYGCKNSGHKSRFSPGQCVVEKQNNYASYVKQSGPIYKIDSDQGKNFKVSIWHNHSWLYQGLKRKNYFKDRKTLVYNGINCPDGRSKASITDKLKGIDL